MNTIRVLCVFCVLDRGGAETMCMNLYRALDRSRVQFDFVKHTTEIGAYEEEIKELGGRIFTAPNFRGSNYWTYKKWWENHFKTHQEHRIVHGHYFTISAVYLSIARRYNRIAIGHVHTSKGPNNNLKGLLIRCLEHQIGHSTDYRFACSAEAGRHFYRNKEFNVLPNAILSKQFSFDPQTRQCIRGKMSISEEAVVVLTVANFSPYKNPIGLIHIFGEIKKRLPNAVLLWAGNGNLMGMVEVEIKRLGLDQYCSLLGTRSDIKDLMQASDIFILPSIQEGLPLVAIEAQASGLPCLLSDIITKEVDITGLCDFLPVCNPELWAVHAEKSVKMRREDTSDKIIRAGYDVQNTARWLMGFYETVVKEEQA